MAQALVVQQEALANAQARLEQLERELTERPAGGGFLGGLFGGEREPAQPRQRHSRPGQGPWSQPYGRGGGFLAGAAQTAMGVAGGVLIANAIADLLGPDEVAAAEPGPQEDPAAGDDLGADDQFGDAGDIGFDEF
jgi:hypothetical protein